MGVGSGWAFRCVCEISWRRVVSCEVVGEVGEDSAVKNAEIHVQKASGCT